MTSIKQKEIAGQKLVAWLEENIIQEATGSSLQVSDTDPRGRFWLGRLAPKSTVMGSSDRGERFEPCSVGIRVIPVSKSPQKFEARIGFNVWTKEKKTKTWVKSPRIEVDVPIKTNLEDPSSRFGQKLIPSRIAELGLPNTFAAEVVVDVRHDVGRDPYLDITLVNLSGDPESSEISGGRIFESSIEIINLKTGSFLLEGLPDSFRYDRRVPAWGINCGILQVDETMKSKETPVTSKMRPDFRDHESPFSNLSFAALEKNPVGICAELVKAYERWGEIEWSVEKLDLRAQQEKWSSQMRLEAQQARKAFEEERRRLNEGVNLLETNEDLRTAFANMNRAMELSAHGKYNSWRGFQVGFLLANLKSIVDRDSDPDIVDIVWFATGGGKTETYLGLIITSALMDRMNGKTTGITAWSRFPLRMLSLQQTQRFANALAAAEIVRRELNLEGDAFSLGFLVGQGATPNKIVKEARNKRDIGVDDIESNQYQIIEECPFCRSNNIQMKFDRKFWRLEHRCSEKNCAWGGGPLPLFVVDDEIWRFLPTVVVGTLDKAANISRQPAMRGLVGSPWALCSKAGHGYTYASRSDRPNGCLVPDCVAAPKDLPMEEKKFPPQFRLQDELHLLRDSLGAVDAHYEAILDGIQEKLTGHKPKILASSATLSGYEKQVEVLYRRRARVFPLAPPSTGSGFWSRDSRHLMRRFLAVAPRGVTIEFAVDRLIVALQRSIRRLNSEPNKICEQLGIDAELIPFLLEAYGTDVIYGNTLRDLDAVMRSSETQLSEIDGPINVDTLTGRTDFAKVRQTLKRLEHPEANFAERLHLIPASSMMSHGVDVDNLNVMVMLGLPLGTAEFIQATARVGRKWPGLVIVVHKIGRERDASVFRCFPQYISHGDRFVEPIPITRRSRRVLERTIAGLEFALIHQVHEPDTRLRPAGQIALTTLKKLAQWKKENQGVLNKDRDSLLNILGITKDDFNLDRDIEGWFRNFERNIDDPPSDARFGSDASPTGAPMLSLRDVEEQAPVSGEDPS